MAESYHSELDEIVHELVTMSDSVRVAVRDATRALLEADASIAERVMSGDARIDAMHDRLEHRCFSLLARSTPVAGRTGDLAAHVAEIARMRYPEHAVPEPLVPNFTRMSQVAQEMVGKAGRTLLERDTDAAATLAGEDDEMDELRNEQFRLIASDDWTFGAETAVDTALLGRYYERIADHAVAMGGRIIYVITGEAPEGEDWPTT